MGVNKWACRRQGNLGVRGAIKGTKDEVLAWMKSHFAGLRPCDMEHRVIPAWIAGYKGEAMIFETARGEEVYLVEDIGAHHKDEALTVLAEMNKFLDTYSMAEVVKEEEKHYLPLLEKLRSLGWVALSDKVYKKNGVVHFRQKLVDPDSEETWDIP